MTPRPAVRQAGGDLLLPLSDDDRARYTGPRGSQPRAGTIVRLWRLPGTWSVWSAGPAVGTWWVQPHDEQARDVAVLLADKPSRGAPTVTAVWAGKGGLISLSIRSKDIRSGGR